MRMQLCMQFLKKCNCANIGVFQPVWTSVMLSQEMNTPKKLINCILRDEVQIGFSFVFFWTSFVFINLAGQSRIILRILWNFFWWLIGSIPSSIQMSRINSQKDDFLGHPIVNIVKLHQSSRRGLMFQSSNSDPIFPLLGQSSQRYHWAYLFLLTNISLKLFLYDFYHKAGL